MSTKYLRVTKREPEAIAVAVSRANLDAVAYMPSVKSVKLTVSPNHADRIDIEFMHGNACDVVHGVFLVCDRANNDSHRLMHPDQFRREFQVLGEDHD